MKNHPAVNLLRKLISIDSTNPFQIEKISTDPSTWIFSGNEQKIAAELKKQLKKSGFTTSDQAVHRCPDGKICRNLLAEKGKGKWKKSLLFYGHMDTVTAKPWLSLSEALTPERTELSDAGTLREVIVGLGANDMKAGLAVMATAFSGLDPDFKIKLAFGCDEEFYSLGANVLAGSDFMADVAAIVVPEMGDGPNPSCGVRTIGLGRLGRCEYVIRVPGTGGHGSESRNPAFVNPASECAKIILELEKIRLDFIDRFRFVPESVQKAPLVNQIEGSFFVNKVEIGDGNLSIPASGEITVDWTFTPGFSIERAEQLLQSLIAEMYKTKNLAKTIVSGKFLPVTVSRKLRPTLHSDAYLTPHDHPFVKFVISQLKSGAGFTGFNMGYSVADENVFKRLHPEIPVLVLGPIGDFSHRAGEWVDLKSVEELSDAYQRIVEKFPEYLREIES
ncbi:MAG: M20/M25/M40 family metallo-hydrolase [Candidatus Wallbacteria bacterium]|nr:M20/M25/M40 family metallo-hydrolase [Candidatus Wallbacteria bacterium]